MRSRRAPWGLPGLSRSWQEYVIKHNILMLAGCEFLEALDDAGASITKEHPGDSGRPRNAYFFSTDFWRRLSRRRGLGLVTFPQCALGARVRKLTSVAWKRAIVDAFQGLQCTHTVHDSLFGLDESGQFRTRAAQAYPPRMCELLAEAHLLSWEKRPPLCGDSRLVEDVNSDLLREHPEAGTRLPVPECSSSWDAASRWREVARWPWETQEHINVLECRTAVSVVDRLSRVRSCWNQRYMTLSDSQVTIGVLSKGRSSRKIFNQLARRVAASALGLRIRMCWRYIRTHRNCADGPSRNQPIGVAEKESPVMVGQLPSEFLRHSG